MSTTMMMTTTIIEGRFRLGEEICEVEADDRGHGDLGSRPKLSLKNNKARVFRAEDLETGETVAIKILNRGSSKITEFRSRFLRDAEIMRSFQHPNVVKTIASGITPEGQPYFAMEFLEGRTLARRIADQGPVPVAELGRYLEQIASALDLAHARGIVHRDINPGAIMIKDGSTEIRFLDFGLAKNLIKPSVSEIELTGKQTILGKAAYLSPEQARGGEIDGRSDVYSLGVTLYEALTGRLPFEGETDFQILLAQINGTVPPFPRRWSDHPGAQAIEALVLKTLAKNPADRPANAGILSNLFGQALLATPKRNVGLALSLLAAGSVLVTSAILLGKWLL